MTAQKRDFVHKRDYPEYSRIFLMESLKTSRCISSTVQIIQFHQKFEVMAFFVHFAGSLINAKSTKAAITLNLP